MMTIATANPSRAVMARRFSAVLPSPLDGVSDLNWASFVRALEVQPVKTVSESGGLGAYDMRPRRLVEIGYGCNLHTARTDAGRQVYECDFREPWSREKFLSDIMAQYRVLSHSMALYRKELASGVIAQPEGVSLAGALAILHVGGKGALRAWPDLFENTRARYEAAQGAF
jgi:hypothetical protein